MKEENLARSGGKGYGDSRKYSRFCEGTFFNPLRKTTAIYLVNEYEILSSQYQIIEGHADDSRECFNPIQQSLRTTSSQ
jgi:hypothetical protein